jgi:predicted esterase YcpF (UPF0227 family)
MAEVVNINKFIIKELQKENTKISKKVLNFFDKDRIEIYLVRGGGFYIERISDLFTVPNYVYNYLIKKTKKLLKTYYIFDNLSFVRG